jgi:hypothetical protein
MNNIISLIGDRLARKYDILTDAILREGAIEPTLFLAQTSEITISLFFKV